MTRVPQQPSATAAQSQARLRSAAHFCAPLLYFGFDRVPNFAGAGEFFIVRAGKG